MSPSKREAKRAEKNRQDAKKDRGPSAAAPRPPLAPPRRPRSRPLYRFLIFLIILFFRGIAGAAQEYDAAVRNAQAKQSTFRNVIEQEMPVAIQKLLAKNYPQPTADFIQTKGAKA